MQGKGGIYSSDINFTSTSMNEDFQINEIESYYLRCKEAGFWKPSCETFNNTKKYFYFQQYGVEIENSTHYLIYNNKKLASFEYNGEPNYLKNISLEISNSTDNEEYIIIKNLTVYNKTIILEKKKIESNSVCISDSEIENKQGLENSCEIIPCPGNDSTHYCTIKENYYFISGLQHSGVKEIISNFSVKIISPVNRTYNISTINLDYVIEDSSKVVKNCWWTIDTGQTNQSMKCLEKVSLYNKTGSTTLKVFISDISNNIRSAEVTFNIILNQTATNHSLKSEDDKNEDDEEDYESNTNSSCVSRWECTQTDCENNQRLVSCKDANGCDSRFKRSYIVCNNSNKEIFNFTGKESNLTKYQKITEITKDRLPATIILILISAILISAEIIIIISLFKLSRKSEFELKDS
jgi:hypothetical protein